MHVGRALNETAFNVLELSGGREGRVTGGILVRTQGPDLVCRSSMTPVGSDGITASAVQLVCGLRNLAALIAGSLELVRTRLARAVAAGDRGGPVGRAAGDLVERHLPGMAVIEADNHHAEVQEVGDDREQRRFLPAMLGGG
jgi:hypothetical protein